MSVIKQLNDHLQSAFHFIDELDKEPATDKKELSDLQQQLSRFILKLKSKKINLEAIDASELIDKNTLTTIMNRMIGYAELNFNNQLEITGENDVIDTLATAVNLLGEEFAAKVKELQELNITLKITTENSEARQQELYGIRKALDNSALIFITDAEGIIIKANKGFCEASNYSEDELIGRNHSIVNSRFHSKEFWSGMWSTVSNGKSWRNEIKCLAKNGSEFWVDAVINPVTSIKGDITHYLCISNLITKKKAQEAKLIDSEKAIRQSLAEKDVLFQELHHKVKNNLMVISGLMELQIKRSKNAEVVQQLTESHRRIKAIAVLQEKICQAENISEINISEYTNSLISLFMVTYGEHKGTLIKVKHDIEKGIILNIARAVPYGLIFNEIFSNCYKHAFGEGEKGVILVSLCKAGDKTLLKIKDSGKGMNGNVNVETIKSLGIKLIKSLSQQLKAEVSFNNNKKGLEVCVEFD